MISLKNLLSSALVGGTVLSSPLFAAHQSGKVPEALGEASAPSLPTRGPAAAQGEEERRIAHVLSLHGTPAFECAMDLGGVLRTMLDQKEDDKENLREKAGSTPLPSETLGKERQVDGWYSYLKDFIGDIAHSVLYEDMHYHISQGLLFFAQRRAENLTELPPFYNFRHNLNIFEQYTVLLETRRHEFICSIIAVLYKYAPPETRDTVFDQLLMGSLRAFLEGETDVIPSIADCQPRQVRTFDKHSGKAPVSEISAVEIKENGLVILPSHGKAKKVYNNLKGLTTRERLAEKAAANKEKRAEEEKRQKEQEKKDQEQSRQHQQKLKEAEAAAQAARAAAIKRRQTEGGGGEAASLPLPEGALPLKGPRPASLEGKVKSRPSYVIPPAVADTAASEASEAAASAPLPPSSESEPKPFDQTREHIRNKDRNAVSYRDLIHLCSHHGIAVARAYGSHVRLTFTAPDRTTKNIFVVDLHGGQTTYGPRTLNRIEEFLKSCRI